jgi:hypothetical protein
MTARSSNTETLEQLRAKVAAESNEGRSLADNLQRNPICTVVMDESVPCLVVTWKRYATSAQLRYIHESILALCTQHKISKILADDSAIPLIHADDQHWVSTDWMPRARAAGFRVAATKSSESFFGKRSIADIRAAAPSGILFRNFPDLRQASDWLRGLAITDA